MGNLRIVHFVKSTTVSLESNHLWHQHLNICQINKDWSDRVFGHECNCFQSSMTSACMLRACGDWFSKGLQRLENHRKVEVQTTSIQSTAVRALLTVAKKRYYGFPTVDFHCAHRHLHQLVLVSSWGFQSQCCWPTSTQSRPEAEHRKYWTRNTEEISQDWEEIKNI